MTRCLRKVVKFKISVEMLEPLVPGFQRSTTYFQSIPPCTRSHYVSLQLMSICSHKVVISLKSQYDFFTLYYSYSLPKQTSSLLLCAVLDMYSNVPAPIPLLLLFLLLLVHLLLLIHPNTSITQHILMCKLHSKIFADLK